MSNLHYRRQSPRREHHEPYQEDYTELVESLIIFAALMFVPAMIWMVILLGK